MPISPWDDFAELDSPDGRWVAVYDEASEIAMGAPTSGVIRVSDKRSSRCVATLDYANGSFVWSSDSAALAFPRWTRSRDQQLVVFRIAEQTTEPVAGHYRVLALSSFHDGVIEGIDSPIHLPAPIRVAVKT